MKQVICLTLLVVSTVRSTVDSPYVGPQSQRLVDLVPTTQEDLILPERESDCGDGSEARVPFDAVDFRNLKLMFGNDVQQNGYDSYEDLLQKVPLDSSGHVDVRFNSEDVDRDMDHLMASHLEFEADVIRGLTVESSLPFLSLKLERDQYAGQCSRWCRNSADPLRDAWKYGKPVLLICVFESDDVANVMFVGKTRNALSMTSLNDFGVDDLNRLLRRKWIVFPDYEPVALWALNRGYCCGAPVGAMPMKLKIARSRYLLFLLLCGSLHRTKMVAY